MSHVAEIAIEINDLECLKRAAKNLGMELVEASTYRWYGRSVGDYPLPKGFSKGDLGKCDYAIKIPGNSQAYEIGVVKRKDGKPGYQLIWDFWQGGFGLTKVVGETGGKIKQEYAVELAIKHQRRKGMRCSRFQDEKGNIIVRGASR